MYCYKYHGLGNDFLLFDNLGASLNETFIQKLCHRKFGIGADGCIFLRNCAAGVTKMHFFNSDGKKASFCGNASRVVVFHLNEKSTKIHTDAGLIEGENRDGQIYVKMPKVLPLHLKCVDEAVNMLAYSCGVDHGLVFVKDFDTIKTQGRLLRQKTSCNISFVKKRALDCYDMRTYERGVEDFTLACGSAAACLGNYILQKYDVQMVTVKMLGGELKFYQDKASALWMIGTATKVGLVHIDENF